MNEWREIADLRPVWGKCYLVFGSSDRMKHPQITRIAYWAEGFHAQTTGEKLGGWQSHWMDMPEPPLEDDN